jgi:hypothetical protein
MVEICVLTYNNGVGIVTDAILLKDLIYNNISEQVDIKFVGEQNLETADLGIWIQNYDINLLNLFKKNIFFINEEWAGINELSNLHLFEYVICKSKYAQTLLKTYCNVIYIPFISRSFYNPVVQRQNQLLHFVGRSIQKNTELILSTTNKFTLIDPYNRYKVCENVNHINEYQSTDQLVNLLNSHNIHICCSLYESWGHYLYEGLSTGAEIICSDIPTFKEQLDPDLVHFIPTIEKVDLKYSYNADNINKKFPLRKSFHIDEMCFKDKIENFNPIGKSEERRKLFNNIIHSNKKKIIDFITTLT